MTTFTLGTAQLGMKYGAVNDTGKPARTEAVCILKRALECGACAIDTARCYGDAEEIVGDAIAENRQVPVITKLHLLARTSPDADESAVRAAVEGSILSSRCALRTDRLDTVLLHDWKHYSSWNGAAWRRLLDFQAAGTIRRLGASLYEPSQALQALRDPAIQHLQIPFNILDWRWKAASIEDAIAARPDVVLHVRSALLQGILVQSAERWPEIPGFDTELCAKRLVRLTHILGRESRADLCFAYVRAQSWVDSVVVGCETLAQLEADLHLFALPPLSADQCDLLERSFVGSPAALLNPSQWTMATAAAIGANA